MGLRGGSAEELGDILGGLRGEDNGRTGNQMACAARKGEKMGWAATGLPQKGWVRHWSVLSTDCKGAPAGQPFPASAISLFGSGTKPGNKQMTSVHATTFQAVYFLNSNSCPGYFRRSLRLRTTPFHSVVS